MAGAAVVAVLAVLAAGCGGETEGSAEAGQPDNGQQPEERDDLPHSGAPAVDDPIMDTQAFEEDPCSGITDEQLAEADVNIRDSEAKETQGGPTCDWSMESEDGAGEGGFSVILNTANPDGLSGEYDRSSEVGYFEEWEPVEGHPTTAGDLTEDGPERGKCNISVGLRDDLVLVLGMTAAPNSPFREEPCAAAHELAGLAVQTMKDGA